MARCSRAPRAPVVVRDRVTPGHQVVLHGCTIEGHCLIGMGAVVLNNARIGEGSIVVAGSLVLEDAEIPPGSPYMGTLARFRRRLTDTDRGFIDIPATHSLQYKESCLAELGKKVPG